MSRAGFERLGRIWTAAFGLGFVLIGLRYFFDPGALTIETDVTMPTTKAVMEIRTVYGGMFVGVGLATFVLGVRRATLPSGLWALAIIGGSVALARIAAILLGQRPDTLFAVLLAVELIGVTIALWVLWAMRRSIASGAVSARPSSGELS